ncbi:MAG: hypothetical protein AAF805_10605 [Planctomycetota bacterium]
MFDQRVFFRVMLWSFAVAAVSGVAAVLAGGFDTIGRVLATAFLTAVVSAVLWQVTLRCLDRPRTASVAQGVGLAVFLFSLLGIWGIGPAERCGQTAALLTGASLLVAIGRWPSALPLSVWAGRVVVGVTAFGSLSLLVLIWRPDTSTRDKLAACVGVLACWAVGAAVSVVGLGTRPRRDWRWVGVGAATVGFGFSVYGVLVQVGYSQNLINTLCVLATVTAMVGHALLVLLARLPGRLNTLRFLAVASAVCTGVLVDGLVVFEIDGDTPLVRGAAASAILASFTTLAVGLIAQHRRWQIGRESRIAVELSESIAAVDPDRSVDLVIAAPGRWDNVVAECPQCGRRHGCPVGESVCAGCGVLFRLRVMTPDATTGTPTAG